METGNCWFRRAVSIEFAITCIRRGRDEPKLKDMRVKQIRKTIICPKEVSISRTMINEQCNDVYEELRTERINFIGALNTIKVYLKSLRRTANSSLITVI